MGIFDKNSEGGILDVIRCDEAEYLVWKWRPSGETNSTNKENSIRYGSSLRVKDGEVAVFVYRQKDGSNQDFIIGPYDQTIKTANLPILSAIVGAAYGGESPFQAEVYFINLSGNIQVRFGVPYFDVFDPRFQDFAVPVAARGTLTFHITDFREFIKLNRLINFDLDAFTKQIKDAVNKYTKGVIANITTEQTIPVLQIERKIIEVNEKVMEFLKIRLQTDFGVTVKGLDLAAIEIDKESKGYHDLRLVTADQTTKTTLAQTEIGIKNAQDMQQINAENLEESLRIQREESQRAQKLQTETSYLGAHTLNQQAEVLKTAAQNLSNMSTMNTGGEGGINPAGMMTGMMMGGAMGNQMAGMMNQLGQQANQQMNTPPPPPQTVFHVAVNGKSTGPFTLHQLQQMAQAGNFNENAHVWKHGMNNWELAGNLPELSALFSPPTPPPPPVP